jgi:hypothetical protein
MVPALVGIVLAVAAMVVIGVVMGRRQRRWITEVIESKGGFVRRIKIGVVSPQFPYPYCVTFESVEGDLRYACARIKRGQVEFCAEQSYQHHLEGELYRGKKVSAKKVNLEDLVWHSKLTKLPGYSFFSSAMMDLAAGKQKQVEIVESPGASRASGKSFAAIYQCALMQTKSSDDCLAGSVELVANKVPFKLIWCVEGTRPNRKLLLSASKNKTEVEAKT